MTDDFIGRSTTGVKRRWYVELLRDRAAQHELQPMGAGILAGDQQSIDVPILYRKEIRQVGAQHTQAELPVLPTTRTIRQWTVNQVLIEHRRGNQPARPDKPQHQKAKLIQMPDYRNPIWYQIDRHEQIRDAQQQHNFGQRACVPVEQNRPYDTKLLPESSSRHS